MAAKLIELDLDVTTRLGGLAEGEAADVLLRRGRQPVGRVHVVGAAGLLDLGPLAAESGRRPTDDEPVPASALPSVSAVICTRDRPEDLVRALRSLARQEHPPDDVLVIDNGTLDGIRERVEAVLPRARVVRERRPGLDVARNRALREAAGEVIAFLDDDAEADGWWVRSLAEAFAAHPRAAAVTGLILPLELETPAQQLFEANGGFARGFERRVLPRDGERRFGVRMPLVSDALTVGSGCNMAFRADVLRELGGFDEALDTGAPLPGGGDLDAIHRVLRAGHDLVYEPGVLVRHRHRRSLTGLRAQMTGHYRALSAFLVKALAGERGRARLGVAAFLAWRLAKSALRMPRRLVGRDPLPLPLLLGLFVAGIAGLGSYPASRLRMRAHERRRGGSLPGLLPQLADLWGARELVVLLAARDLKVKYQRSWLGFLWTLLNPLVTVGVLVAVFSQVIRIPIEHYWAFLISGYFVWNFFAQTLNGGVQSAAANAYLTRTCYFPQEVLVLSASLARLLEFLVEMALLLVVLAVFHHGSVPASFAAVLPLLPILFVLVVGVAFPLVALAVHYQDAVQAIPLATAAWFYVTPVFYELDLVPEELRGLFLLNPLAPLLGAFQAALYRGVMPSAADLSVLAALASVLAVAGYALFNRRKRGFAEIV
jgi:ABC-type polysaccharide/polyol phosphate export permease/GT2 family glycosyltransferase